MLAIKDDLKEPLEMDDDKMYLIQEGDLVHINSWGMHKYQNWSDKEFRMISDGVTGNDEIHLEYWLDGDGKYTNKNIDKLMVFGKGKRDCVGRRVAIKALQSMFGLLIIRYKFNLNDDFNIKDCIKQLWATVQFVDPPIGLKLTQRHNVD